MNTSTLLYSIKIWVAAAFIAPFLQCGIEFLSKPDFYAGYYIYIAVSTGVLLSVPSLILFWLTTLCMKKVACHATLVKLLLTMAGIVLAVLLVFLMANSHQFAVDIAYLPIPYTIAVVGLIWLFDLPVLDRQRYMETVNA
jgi:hypothetical protein